jgi:hypothetical protein
MFSPSAPSFLCPSSFGVLEAQALAAVRLKQHGVAVEVEECLLTAAGRADTHSSGDVDIRALERRAMHHW